MFNSKSFNRSLVFATIALSGILFSCKEDEPKSNNADDGADVLAEAQAAGYFQDMDDMGLQASNDDKTASGGRLAEDNRFICADITVADGATFKEGSFIIDFGTGCTDAKGNVRKGKLNVVYSKGPIYQTGFTAVITPTAYTINGIQLEGTRTITKLESASGFDKHQVLLSNGKATWPDGTSITRMESFVRTLDTNNFNESFSDGTASGTNKRGQAYTSEIIETLVIKGSCISSDGIYTPVSGILKFISGGRELTLNYGDGACDRSILVQSGNYSVTVTAPK